MLGALTLPRVGLLVNPTAGKDRGARLGAAARGALVAAGHEVTDLSGPDAPTAAASAREALHSSRLDVLVVVGGDGMAHLGTNLVAGTGIPLAIVAAGTGNDNARELGLPLRDARAACALVTAGHTRTVDAGRCVTTAGEERWWLGVLGAGSTRWWPSGPAG